MQAPSVYISTWFKLCSCSGDSWMAALARAKALWRPMGWIVYAGSRCAGAAWAVGTLAPARLATGTVAADR